MAEEPPTVWLPSGGPAASSVARLARSLRQNLAPQRATHTLRRPEEETVPGQPPTADRRLLWVDGVGGYQLVLVDEVTLGRGGPGSPNPPHVAVRANLAAQHARIARRDGAYLFTPLGPVEIDGRPATGPTALGGDARIDLLATEGHRPVSLRLRRPHPLSATAVLTVESGHRTEPMIDAVLLMAESCILGPGSHSHIRCPGASADAVLHRDGAGLACRTAEGGGPIAIGERFEAQDLSFCVELVAGT